MRLYPAINKFALLLTFALTLLTGCGRSARCDVTGQVKVGKTPLKLGAVVFFAADGSHYPAPIDGEGKYHVAGVPVGELRVAVYCPDPVLEYSTPPSEARAAEIRKAKGWKSIPGHYNDPGMSKLTLTATPPTCEYNIDIPE